MRDFHGAFEHLSVCNTGCVHVLEARKWAQQQQLKVMAAAAEEEEVAAAAAWTADVFP